MDSYYNRNRWAMGFWISLSVFIKPFGLIFLGLLFLILFFTSQKQAWKAVMSFVLSSFILFLLPFIFYPKISIFQELNIAWINELSIEMGTKQNLLASRNHTIFSVLYRYTPMRYISLEETGKKAYQFVVLLLMGITYMLGIFFK